VVTRTAWAPLFPSEQCGHAAGDQLQGEAPHGDQRGEEAPGLPGRASVSPLPDGAGAHGQLGGEERHRQHHSSAGQSVCVGWSEAPSGGGGSQSGVAVCVKRVNYWSSDPGVFMIQHFVVTAKYIKP